MNYEQAKQIDMVDYLARLGFQPARIMGNDYWYLTPFNTEKTPSFKINRNKNVFYCHANGFGGTIIDFAMRLYNTDVSGALAKIAESSAAIQVTPAEQQVKAEPESRIEIISATKPITSAYLLGYLEHRCINVAIAQEYCAQVRYKNGGNVYVAVGFKNDLGGYELRSPHFKGSSSPKAPTFIDRGFKTVAVTEGFMSFMSLVQLSGKLPESNFLVLNSTSMLKAALPILLSHEKNLLYLDNDKGGQRVTTLLTTEQSKLPEAMKKEKLPELLAPGDHARFTDMASSFAPHKDLNKLLVATCGKRDIQRESNKGYLPGIEP